MFKKAFQVLTAFGVLLAGYAGYVRLFAIVAAGVGQTAQSSGLRHKNRSKTEVEAIELAAKGFGKAHWAADKDLPVRYYNHERGYWMYAKSYQRLNEGKQLRFTPFAIIWQSRDGKALKTATSDGAIVDLDQPLGLSNKSNSPMKVVHARIEGDVRLRDDKGTPDNRADDLVIGPMPYVEYDEAALQIKSDSDIVIQDRDMRITGTDLLIQLRSHDEISPPGAAGGLHAKSAVLRKNVHIILSDVGPTGIMPGTAGAEQKNGDRTPLDLRCAGLMKVELPKPRLPVRVGPPAPPAPTVVKFNRDVVVMRGKVGQTPDQLNCDQLELTLLPTEKPPAAAKPNAGATATAPATAVAQRQAPSQAASSDEDEFDDEEQDGGATGAGTELTLRVARATGHAVWLQSKGQGITARCNELIHKKLLPDNQPDETYLRGDRTTKLWVEKLDIPAEGPEKGKVQGVTTIRTIDATIFDNGQGDDNATIVARGPGVLETRAARDRPVERRALWQDHLILQTELGPDKQPKKRITLTGRPEFIDLAQATLDARDKIIVWLKPKPGAPADVKTASTTTTTSTSPKRDAAVTPTAQQGGAGAFQLEMLQAFEDVHLNAPGKIMTARDRLDVVFHSDPAAATLVPAPGAGAAPTAAPPAGAAASPGTAAPAAPQPAEPKPAEPAKEKPREPDISIRANRIWARVHIVPGANTADTQAAGRQGGAAAAGAGGRSEVEVAMLREKVFFHQDPEPGKARGIDVTGEALDMYSLGEGKMKLQVENLPQSAKASAAEFALAPHARVVTEEMTITGPRIGLDQSTDQAWVKGPGTLTQMAQRGLLTDKGLNGAADPNPNGQEKARGPRDRAAARNKPPQRPLTISWKSEMRFAGRAAYLQPNQPVARVQFFANVRADMEDAQLACTDRMDVYMDRVVALARPKQPPKRDAEADDPAEPEPRPQIALIDCFRDVTIKSRKVDPNNPRLLLQKQQIQGDRVTYNKVTGNFHVPSAGKVYLWNREEGGDGGPGGTPAPGASGRRITPTGLPGPGAPGAGERTPPVIGRNSSQVPSTRPAILGRTQGNDKRKALPPLKLTLITFSKEMLGRFITGKDNDTTETRWADFFGDVQALNAKVADESSFLEFDRPPDDGLFLTAQTMRVISVPAADPKKGTARHYLKAWDNSQAKTRSETIVADVITYDSEKGLFYAYGNEGREVMIATQASAGQPFGGGRGRAVQYNRLTGEAQVMEPRNYELVDTKTGVRPGATVDPKPGIIKTPRVGSGLKLTPRTDKERAGMNGR